MRISTKQKQALKELKNEIITSIRLRCDELEVIDEETEIYLKAKNKKDLKKSYKKNEKRKVDFIKEYDPHRDDKKLIKNK
jgi:hypothetical protein